MKRLDRGLCTAGLGGQFAILLVAAAVTLIDLPASPASAMTAIDDLVRKLELESDYDERYRRSQDIREFVCRMDPAEYTDELVDQLIVLALDSNELVRTMTASALLCIGPRAKRAIPTLEKALDMVRPINGWIARSGEPRLTMFYVIQELRKM